MNSNEIGNRQPATGNWESGIGHRGPATGNRGPGTGNRESETRNRTDGRRRSALGLRAALTTFGITAFGIAALSGGVHAQPLAPKDTRPYTSAVYGVSFSYPKNDWVAVPATGGNIALLMQEKGEASLALDFQVLRVALAPDEIDDTFKEIELEQLAQRTPHARVVSSALSELAGNKVVVIRYGASGLTGDLDVTQYSVVSGASLYRLTCASTRATAAKHARACETVVRTLAVGKK